MKSLLIACSLLFLAGCASTHSATAELDPSDAAREKAIAERAALYQKRGMSSRDAFARAESDVDGTLTPLLKAEPHARGRPR